MQVGQTVSVPGSLVCEVNAELSSLTVGVDGFMRLPESTRLTTIHHAFADNSRAAAWHSGVRKSWHSVPIPATPGSEERLDFYVSPDPSDPSTAVHVANHTSVQLSSDLTFSVYTCGRRVTLPTDAPVAASAMLFTPGDLAAVLAYVRGTQPCNGITDSDQLETVHHLLPENCTTHPVFTASPSHSHAATTTVADPSLGECTNATCRVFAPSCAGLVSGMSARTRCCSCHGEAGKVRAAISHAGRRTAAEAAAAAAAAAALQEGFNASVQRTTELETENAAIRKQLALVGAKAAELENTIEQSRHEMMLVPAEVSDACRTTLQSKEAQAIMDQHPECKAIFHDQEKYFKLQAEGGRARCGMRWHAW